MITLIDNPYFIPAIIFGTIVLVFYALKLMLDQHSKDQSINERADKWGAYNHNNFAKDDSLAEKQSGLLQWFLNRFRSTGQKKDKSGMGIYSDTPLDFQRAGLYDPLHIRIYRVARILLTILPGLGYFTYLTLTGQFINIRSGDSLIVLWVSGVFFLLPMFWMKHRVSKRKQEFEKAFPNAMDLLIVCVEAGMGFDAAVARVSTEMELSSPLLAREFKILSLELKTGKSRNDCMENLAKRINISDIDNLVNLLTQAEKFGTGIAHPLRVHAEQMREKRYNKMEELAAKLPVKLSFPLVLFIFPAMMIALIGPSIIMIYRSF